MLYEAKDLQRQSLAQASAQAAVSATVGEPICQDSSISHEMTWNGIVQAPLFPMTWVQATVHPASVVVVAVAVVVPADVVDSKTVVDCSSVVDRASVVSASAVESVSVLDRRPAVVCVSVDDSASVVDSVSALEYALEKEMIDDDASDGLQGPA